MTENTEEELVEAMKAAARKAMDEAWYASEDYPGEIYDREIAAMLDAGLTAICSFLGTTPEGLAEIAKVRADYVNTEVHWANETISLRAESTRLREALRLAGDFVENATVPADEKPIAHKVRLTIRSALSSPDVQSTE